MGTSQKMAAHLLWVRKFKLRTINFGCADANANKKLSILGVHLLSGCSGNPEYLVQLVEDVSDPGEAGVAVHHLHEDAAGPPHIQTE